MKRVLFFITFAFFTAVNGSCLFAQLNFSGVVDTTASTRAGAGESPDVSFGFEQFANIRFQARLRERGRFMGAVNLFAAAGDTAAAAAVVNPHGIVAGENYIAGIEVERLQFRLDFETVDFDGGLMRLPFGFSQVWGSSDFLNPPNPLRPDARPRAVLATSFTWFPVDMLSIVGFGTTGRDPFSVDGRGAIMGLSMSRHWSRASLQLLYSFETPQDVSETWAGSRYGVHRAGASLRADLVLGFVVDALYSYNHYAQTRMDGLSLSAGFDYSFFGGNLIFLAEYLFNGAASSTALGFGGSFSNRHYLYTGFNFRFNDFTHGGLALISGLSDTSFTPLITFNRDIVQGATLTFTAQVPMDPDLFTGNGRRGEFGPLPPGSTVGRYFDFSMRLRIRF